MAKPITYTLLLANLDDAEATYTIDPAIGVNRNQIRLALTRPDWVALGHPSRISVHVDAEVPRG